MRLFKSPAVTAVLLLGVVALALAAPRPQESEFYDDEELAEEEPPPPPPSPTPRNPLNRGRGPALRKPTATKKATESTTAAPPPPPPPAQETSEEEDLVDAPEVGSTEAPKKYLLAGRNGVVRPFRSHEDLLAALKRRRANGASVPTHAPTSREEEQPSSTARPSKPARTSGNLAPKGRFGNARTTPEPAQEPSAPPRARSLGTSSRRFGGGAARKVQDEVAVEEEESPASEEVAPSRNSRFSPRRRT